jgi:hypothetical protein
MKRAPEQVRWYDVAGRAERVVSLIDVLKEPADMSSHHSHGKLFTDLRPDQLEQTLAEAPVAYVPWGALEWHSVHLPWAWMASSRPVLLNGPLRVLVASYCRHVFAGYCAAASLLSIVSCTNSACRA